MSTPSSKRRATFARHGRLARVGIAAATVGLAVSMPALAGASTAHRAAPAKTPLEKGKAYYVGKTINFVAPDSPGGGYDMWARLLAPELSKYLHATVNVSNIPAGNTVAGQDFVAHSEANGLTVGLMNAGADVENVVLNLPALNFNPLREAILGATAPTATVLLVLNSLACSQFSSFASLVNGTSSSPKIKEALQTTGTTTFTQLMLNTAFGIQFQPITGYQSTTTQLAGFSRGDGCLTITNASSGDALVTGGKAKPILLTAALQPGLAIAPHYAGVPTAPQEYAKYKKSITASKGRTAAWLTFESLSNTTRIFFAPAATSTPEREALMWAFQKGMNDPTLKSAAQQEGNPIGQETATQAKATYAEFLADAKREVPVLQSVIG